MSLEVGIDLYHQIGFGPLVENFREAETQEQIDLAEVAVTLLAMPTDQRTFLSDLIVSDVTAETWNSVGKIVGESISHTEDKLATIGLTMSQYIALYKASHEEEGQKIIEEIIAMSEDVIKRDEVIATVSVEDKKKLFKKHTQIVDQILKEIPTAKEQDREQKIEIIAGPFAAGKTEVVRTRLEAKGFLEIDLDDIRGMLMKDYNPESQADVQRVREESWMVSDLLFRKALETGRSVRIQTALHREERWLTDQNIILSQNMKIPIELYMVARPFSDCLVRNMVREGRSVALLDQLQSIHGMAVLTKFIKRFDNVRKVVILDFYPLIEKQTGMKCVVGRRMYEEMMHYAKNEAKIDMEVREQAFDIEVIDQV